MRITVMVIIGSAIGVLAASLFVFFGYEKGEVRSIVTTSGVLETSLLQMRGNVLSVNDSSFVLSVQHPFNPSSTLPFRFYISDQTNKFESEIFVSDSGHGIYAKELPPRQLLSGDRVSISYIVEDDGRLVATTISHFSYSQ